MNGKKKLKQKNFVVLLLAHKSINHVWQNKYIENLSCRTTWWLDLIGNCNVSI